MSSLLRRSAITVLVPLFILAAGEAITVPGVPRSLVEELGPLAAPRLGIFALGLGPIVAAYMVVELAAMIVPRWRRLRHDNPEGRAKLERAVRAVGLVIALIQGWTFAVTLSGVMRSDLIVRPGVEVEMSAPLVTLTLVAGACLSFIASDLVTRRGLVNGIVLFSVIDALVSLGRSVYASATNAGPKGLLGLFSGGQSLRSLTPLSFVLLFLAVALPLVAGFVVARTGLRGAPGPVVTSEGASPYRSARALMAHPWIPVPSSSFSAYPLAVSLLMLPVTLTSWFPSLSWHANLLGTSTPLYLALLGALLTVAVVVLTRLLHRPADLAALASRLGFANEPELHAGLRQARRAAILPTLIFFAVIALAGTLPAVAHFSLGNITELPLVAALALDLFVSIRGAREDAVPVWAERRVSAVPILRAALEAEGIRVSVRGASVLGLLQAFAPYAPAEIHVPAGDAERATALLRHWLLGETAPSGRPTTSGLDTGAPLDKAKHSRVPLISLVTLLVAGIAADVIGAIPQHREGAHRRPTKLEVVPVDDQTPLFDSVESTALPPGMRFGVESQSAGIRKYVVVDLRESESVESGFARADAWTRQSLSLPPGRRLGWERVDELNDATQEWKPVGIRSFLLDATPVLTNGDIADAVSSIDQQHHEVYVAVTLTREAGERFSAVTEQMVNKRIAIVLDGRVDSAPVVRSKISGGRISITMGSGRDTERQLQLARELAENLAPRR